MKPSDGRVEKKAWGDYQEVNKIFAETIARVYRPGDFGIFFYFLSCSSSLKIINHK